MAGTTAAMELKVLINILQSGAGLQNILNQINAITAALTKLGAIPPPGIPPTPPIPPVPPGLNIPPQAKAATDSMLTLEKAVNRVIGAVKFLAGGFLSLQAVRLAKDVADVAARTQVLETILHIVARNAGISKEEIDGVSQSVQRLGITAQSANQSLVQFIQAGLDIKFAPQVARAAQDLAVIAGLDSSQTFQRLIVNIQQLDTFGLRMMGIIVSLSDATSRYARANGVAASSLSKTQQQQALLNEVLEKAKGFQGTYEAAMGDVGKQTASLTRLSTELKDSLGKNLLPAYSALISELSVFLNQMNNLVKANNENKDASTALAEVIQVIARNLFELTLFLYKHKVAVELVAIAYGTLWTVAKVPPIVRSSWILLGDVLLTVGLYFGNLWIAAEAAAAFLGGGFLLTLGIFGASLAALALTIGGITYFMYQWVAGSEEARKKMAGLYDLTEKLNEAIRQEEEAKKRAVQAAIHGTELEKEATQAALKEATKARKDAEDEVAAHKKKLEQGDPLTKAREEKFLKEQKRANELKQIEAAASAARERLLSTTAVEGVFVPKSFATKDADLQAIIKHYQELQKEVTNTARAMVDANRALKYATTSEELRNLDAKMVEFLKKGKEAQEEVIQGFRDVVPSVSTREAFESFTKRLQQFRDEIGVIRPDILPFIDQLGRLAKLQVQKGDPLFQPLREQADALFKEQQTRLANHLDEQLTILESTHQREEALAKESYGKQLLTTDEYFASRRQRLREGYLVEIAKIENEIQSLQKEQLRKRSVAEIAAVQTRIEAAQGKRRELETQQQTRETDLDVEQRGATEGLERRILEIRLRSAASYGSQAAAIAEINQRYEQQAKDLHVVDGDQQQIVLNEAKRLEIEKVQLEFRERNLRLLEEQFRTTQDLLAIEQSRIDYERRRVQILESTGRISSLEAIRERNALRQREIENNTLLLQSKQGELALKINEYYQRRADIILKQQAAPQVFAPDSPETLARIQNELGNLRSEITGLTKDVLSLNDEIRTSALEMEEFGRKLGQDFADGLANALATTLSEFDKIGQAWLSFGKSIGKEMADIFSKAFIDALMKRTGIKGMLESLGTWLGSFGGRLGGGGGFGGNALAATIIPGSVPFAEGGMVAGPGTGTSDSIPAMLSAGEHVMPAARAAQWMPLLEGIRTGRILPFAQGGMVQSIAIPSVIPRRYASGGMVVSDGGASAVQTGGGGVGNMVVSLHPDTLNMTMREWLEHEVVRQKGRR